MAELDRIEDDLYLGNLEARQDLSSLIKFEIEVVVSVLSKWDHELPFEKLEGIVYHDIALYDDPREDLQKALGKFILIMEKEKGKRVFVHCFAGMSRSPALVIGYLMHRDGLSYHDAYKKLKEARPSILLNDGFIEQLKSLN